MTVKDLKDKVDFLFENGRSGNLVVVKLKEPSVGGIACSKVESIHAGFDWDGGKAIITCEDDLLSYRKDRDNPMSAVKIVYTKYPELKPVIHCPKCENKIRKNDRYCNKCGQAVTTENMREFKR